MPSMTGVALKYFMRIRKACRGKAEWERSLRSRARNMPAVIASQGLVSAMAFLASKSNKEMFSRLVKGGELGNYSKEEAGYTLYLYAIYSFLSGEHKFLGECSDIECLLAELEKLDSDAAAASAAGELALGFAIEFKKLADAVLEGEEE